jgi:hypothetical protein
MPSLAAAPQSAESAESSLPSLPSLVCRVWSVESAESAESRRGPTGHSPVCPRGMGGGVRRGCAGMREAIVNE